ncbi:hypothetical protein L6452_46180 [Arctium lappa]|nr:hypothetical protein L6452_46180 [Arctium lappa]
MWRYPSTASFLEGLWPFRPRKFEAITVAPEAIRPRARLPGRHASRRPRPRLPSGDACRLGRRLVSRAHGAVGLKESPLTDARLVVVVKAFVSSRADAREALSNDPNGSGWGPALRPGRMWNGESRSANRLGAWTGAIGGGGQSPAVDMPVEMPSRRSWLAARAVTACLGTCVLPGTGLRAPHSARLENTDQGV